ncbi:MAG: ATPase, T2SS/T4P/T4SS family, partial [Planctomycetota bacterium]
MIHDPNTDRPNPDASAALPVRGDEVGLRELWRPQTTALVAVRDLGKALEANGTINAAQLATARGVAEKSPGKPLADIFFEMGVDEAALQQTVATVAHLSFERVDPGELEAAKFINRLGVPYCVEHGVLPLRYAGARVVVGLVHPDDLVLLDELRHRIGQSVKPVVVTRGDIAAVAEELKADEAEEADVSMDDVLDGIDEDDVEVVEDSNDDIDLEKMAGESPVIRYVNYLIFNAVKEGASDIHIEPQEKKLRVRYRIDGVMFDATAPPNQMRSAIISRIKIMANLDIAERRLPQDGRIRAMVHGRKLDLRVSTLPMVQGEKCVMRILDTRSIQVDLDDLGFDEDALHIWKSQIDQPHGIVL